MDRLPDGGGYVRIVDRKKEIIINLADTTTSLANIELMLRASSRLIALDHRKRRCGGQCRAVTRRAGQTHCDR